jgi:hypothetical protein
MKRVVYDSIESISYNLVNETHIIVAKTASGIYKLHRIFGGGESCAWISLYDGRDYAIGTHIMFASALKSMLDYGGQISVVDDPLELAEWIEKNYKHNFDPGF